MIRKLFLAAACCLPFSVLAQKGFTINGKVNGADAPAKAVIIYADNGVVVKDSAVIHQGQFSFSGQVKYPTTTYLYILRDPNTQYMAGIMGEEHPRMNLDHFEFWLENSDIKITIQD